MNGPRFVAVTGLAFEARIVAGPGVTVVCGGGQMQLRRSLESAIRKGCLGVLSFGIAGGLAPHLKPGACVVARNIISEHGRYPSDSAWAQSLIGMVQGRTSRFAALQRVSFALPPAALVATNVEGGVDFQAIIRSLVERPGQLPTLLRLALDSWAARRALIPSRRFLGPNLGLPDLREHLLDVA
jgi:hypothetical protein